MYAEIDTPYFWSVMTSGSQYDIDYDNGGVEVDLWAWPEYSGTYYVLSENAVWDMWGDLLWWAETVDSVSVSVPNPRPSITSVSPTPWQAGNSYSVTVSGTGFGTNPTLQISGAGVTLNSYSCSPVDVCDTTITASVTIDPGAPSENASITVTSTGYGGSGFFGSPGESPTSSADSVEVDAAAPTPSTYMVVVSDNTIYCGGCSTAIQRKVTYRVMVNSQLAANTQVCEAPLSSTATNPPCSANSQNAPSPQITACASPIVTDSNGQFTDTWSVNSDAWGPPGCGNAINNDTWQTNQSPTTPIIPFGMLSGGTYTNSVTILGYTSTIANKQPMPTGMVILPQ